MKVIETDGIVLKTMDFKEKDCILTFLTAKVGKKAGILHGGKSLRSGNAAKAELFVLNHFEFSEKPNMDLVRIRKCELQESFPLVRKNYSKFLHASYFSELLLQCEIPELDSHEYFDLLKNAMSLLSESQTDTEIKLNFEIRLLVFSAAANFGRKDPDEILLQNFQFRTSWTQAWEVFAVQDAVFLALTRPPCIQEA